MAELLGDLPRSRALLEQGIADGRHLGAQLSVRLEQGADTGQRDFAVGESAPGTAMTAGTVLPWMSTTKILTGLAVMAAWERGTLALDDPVRHHLAEFTGPGKERVTIRHLLTHTGGLPTAGARRPGRPEPAWAEQLAAVCAAPLDWPAGSRAAYHPHAAHLLLAEIVQRATGGSFARFARQAVLEPAGIGRLWLGIPGEEFDALGAQAAPLYWCQPPGARPTAIRHTREAAAYPDPSSNMRAPAAAVLGLVELLRRGGVAADGRRVLTAQTVEAMTAVAEVANPDPTLGTPVVYTLGLIRASWPALGWERVGYSYGRHASSRAVGHSGAQSSTAFTDPVHGLSVAVIWNGMPGPSAHSRRQEQLLSTLYEELGLAPGPGGAGHR